MVAFIDKIRTRPPCKICGSNNAKQDQIKIDWFGNMKGEWICENGHGNVL